MATVDDKTHSTVFGTDVNHGYALLSVPRALLVRLPFEGVPPLFELLHQRGHHAGGCWGVFKASGEGGQRSARKLAAAGIWEKSQLTRTPPSQTTPASSACTHLATPHPGWLQRSNVGSFPVHPTLASGGGLEGGQHRSLQVRAPLGHGIAASAGLYLAGLHYPAGGGEGGSLGCLDPESRGGGGGGWKAMAKEQVAWREGLHVAVCVQPPYVGPTGARATSGPAGSRRRRDQLRPGSRTVPPGTRGGGCRPLGPSGRGRHNLFADFMRTAPTEAHGDGGRLRAPTPTVQDRRTARHATQGPSVKKGALTARRKTAPGATRRTSSRVVGLRRVGSGVMVRFAGTARRVCATRTCGTRGRTAGPCRTAVHVRVPVAILCVAPRPTAAGHGPYYCTAPYDAWGRGAMPPPTPVRHPPPNAQPRTSGHCQTLGGRPSAARQPADHCRRLGGRRGNCGHSVAVHRRWTGTRSRWAGGHPWLPHNLLLGRPSFETRNKQTGSRRVAGAHLRSTRASPGTTRASPGPTPPPPVRPLWAVPD